MERDNCNFLVLENLYSSDFNKHRRIFVCFTENMINGANKILNSKMLYKSYPACGSCTLLVIKCKDSVGVNY